MLLQFTINRTERCVLCDIKTRPMDAIIIIFHTCDSDGAQIPRLSSGLRIGSDDTNHVRGAVRGATRDEMEII